MFDMLKTKRSDIEMLKIIFCGMIWLLWDRKMYFPQKKNSDFRVDFSYVKTM